MKINAVIISRGYADFLAETLPLNIDHLDQICVVTSAEDLATKAVCNKNSVNFITSPLFDEKGHTFNKGACINQGLDHLHRDEETFFLHLDADVVLCHDFRRLLKHAQIRKENIYGADRVNVYGWDAWQKLKPTLTRQYQDRWFIDPGFTHRADVPEGTRFATRVVHQTYGWIPVGYFQLFHSSHEHRYNVHRGAASGTDVFFPSMWPRQNRVLLPEITCWHLDSELEHKMGTNWKGRKSRPFAPAARHEPERHQNHHHNHHHHKPEHHNHHHCHHHGYEPCPPECHNHRHEGK